MILEAIKRRKSVRSYLDREIPEDILLEVLEAARLSPSASNRQHRKFVIVQDKELKQKIMEASMLHDRMQPFISEAAVIIAGCATKITHIMPNEVYSYPVDMAIALDHISLQAAELGLGTCWIGAFNQDKVKKILHIPDAVKIVCLMTLGYPAEKANERGRKSLEEIICYNHYME